MVAFRSYDQVAPIPTSWSLPQFPYAAREPAELRIVDEALLTRKRQGRLRTIETPTRWLTGAVHDADGVLIPASQKIGGLTGHQGAQADPGRVPVPAGARRLGGTWLYGGHWIQHFGHFINDTVTTLWPEPAAMRAEGVRGLVFHAYFGRHREPAAWERSLLDLTGYGDLPVEIVADAPVRVERLVLPSRPLVVNGWAHPEAVAVWDRMVTAAGPPTLTEPPAPPEPSRTFLSRRRFNEGKRAAGRAVRTHAIRDQRLDEVFAAAGFDIVEPQDLSVHEQIRLAAGAGVVAGSAGSALHLTVFSPSTTRVLELGDDRSPEWRVPHQLVIDAARAHPSAFVPFRVKAAALPAVLAGLGL